MRGERAFTEAVKLPPFSRLHPQLAAYFKQYIAAEKVIRFRDQYVLNTNFPPYPGPAFDNNRTRREHAFFSHDFRFAVGAGLRF